MSLSRAVADPSPLSLIVSALQCTLDLSLNYSPTKSTIALGHPFIVVFLIRPKHL